MEVGTINRAWVDKKETKAYPLVCALYNAIG